MNSAEIDPTMFFTPLEYAARWVTKKSWPEENGSYAARTLIAKGWRLFPSPGVALETLSLELGEVVSASGFVEDGPLRAAFGEVFYGEAEALSILAAADIPKAQEKIDALLRLKLLPLYEWPSRIRTQVTDGAYVNTSELIKLMMAGAHLEGMPLPAMDSATHLTDKTRADGPRALTTNEIANCFAGLRDWNVERWKRELGSPDMWLKTCQHTKGTQGKGGHESTWWPVKLAVALVSKEPKSASYLRARIKRLEPLNSWLDELEINIPDNSEIE